MIEFDMTPRNVLSMTSREIANLTGKNHSHVLRDIRDMLASIYDDPEMDHEQIQGVTFDTDYRGYTSLAHLDKNHTLTLLTGYDAKARKRVIDRWQELEEQARQTPQQVLAEYWAKFRRGAASHYNRLMDEIDAVHDETSDGVDWQTLKIRKSVSRASEANFLNQLILGMDSKDFRHWFRIFDKPIRDSLPEKILDAFEKAEIVDAAMLRDRKPRKERERAIVSMLNVTFPEVLAYRDLLLSECRRIESEERPGIGSDFVQRPNHPSKYQELGPERGLLEMLNVKEAVLLSLTEATRELRQRRLECELSKMDERC